MHARNVADQDDVVVQVAVCLEIRFVVMGPHDKNRWSRVE